MVMVIMHQWKTTKIRCCWVTNQRIDSFYQRFASMTEAPRTCVHSLSRAKSSSTTPKSSDHSIPSSAPSPSPPRLVNVPTLPFIGSMVPIFSGTPVLDKENIYQYFPEMRRRFGDFYTFGIPSLGNDIHGTMYVLQDPNEMAKVIHREGKYPSGLLDKLWVSKKALRDNKSPLRVGDDYGISGRDEGWKRQRTFLNKDMLSPVSARGFVPSMISAAKLASNGILKRKHELNKYTMHCSFDLFNSFMFGELSQSADPDINTDPVNSLFCDLACELVEVSSKISRSPVQKLMVLGLGIDTELYRLYKKLMMNARKLSLAKIKKFKLRKLQGKIDEDERNSYLSRAIDRLTNAKEDATITEDQLYALCSVALGASIDTTSNTLNWNLIHLALNPNVQDKLYIELSTNSAAEAGRDGHLTADILTKSKSPYLHAIIRETHRMTPTFAFGLMKDNATSDVTIHGIKIPKGSSVMLDTYSIGMDSNYVDEPHEFRPERWLPDAVTARVGTHAEIIDHVFFKEPFGQGARRCPGSRIANNKVQTMISQLVLDWKISSPIVKSISEIKYHAKGVVQPKVPSSFEFVPR